MSAMGVVYILLILFIPSDTEVAGACRALYAGHFDTSLFMIVTRLWFNWTTVSANIKREKKERNKKKLGTLPHQMFTAG